MELRLLRSGCEVCCGRLEVGIQRIEVGDGVEDFPARRVLRRIDVDQVRIEGQGCGESGLGGGGFHGKCRVRSEK